MLCNSPYVRIQISMLTHSFFKENYPCQCKKTENILKLEKVLKIKSLLLGKLMKRDTTLGIFHIKIDIFQKQNNRNKSGSRIIKSVGTHHTTCITKHIFDKSHKVQCLTRLGEV